VASYNLNGLVGHGHLVLTELCSAVSNLGVIFLQEHCLTPANMPQLQNFNPLFSAFGISAMEKKISMGLLKGRPFGGAAILVHKRLMGAAVPLLNDERVNVIRLHKILFINVYCPNKSPDTRMITVDMLNDISVICEMNNDCQIIMGGDFNIDLRDSNLYSKPVHTFMQKFSLKLTYDIKKTTCNYTFFRDVLGQKTMIDFFLISQSLAAGLGRHEMGEDLLNFSDHLPLFMSIILDEDELLTRPINSAIQSPDVAAKPLDVPKKRLRWDHAPFSVYCNKTYEALSPIHTRIDACLSRLLGGDEMFLFRNDVHKLKDDVVIVIEEVYSGVVAALTITADACIPLVAPHALKHWWTPELNVLKKT